MSNSVQSYGAAAAQLEFVKSELHNAPVGTQRGAGKKTKSLTALQKQIEGLERIPEGERTARQQNRLERLKKAFARGFKDLIAMLISQGVGWIANIFQSVGTESKRSSQS